MNRDTILGTGIKVEEVHTKQWGTVYIRPARASEVDELMDILSITQGPERLVRLCIFAVVDEDGCRLLSNADIDQLLDGPLEPVQEVAVAFLDACGLDESKKNSATPTTSSTPSPGNGDSPILGLCSK